MTLGRLLLLLSLVLLALADLLLGTVSLDFADVMRGLFAGEVDETVRMILWDYRLPKMLTALLVGVALPTSGLLMQSLFQNPLAGPYVLGISSGASLGSALVLMLGGWYWVSAMPLGVAGAASLGAAGVLLILLLVAQRTQSRYALLVVGLLLSVGCAAGVTLLQAMSADAALRNFVVWTMGSLAGVEGQELLILALATLLGWGIGYSCARALNLLQLGIAHATTRGLEVRRTYGLLFLATGLLAGTTTAFCGPIGFVGIAIPYLARRFMHSADHRILLWVTPLFGACGMLVVDILSSLLARWVALPLNATLALLGIPLVLQMVLGKKNVR